MPEPRMMLESVKIQTERLREETHQLAEALGGGKNTQELLRRLDLALQRWRTVEACEGPLHVVLLGGTGVGKSALFNALLDQSDASPVSHLRAYTRVPYVAAHPQEKPLIDFPQQYHFVPSERQGIVLCDAPDIDSLVQENRQITHQLLENADIVVWVTDPDKRANFAIHEQVRQWGQRAHWYFVLNKIDLYPDQMEAIRSDFDGRLRQLGFIPKENTRFLLSARYPGQYDFPRFREILFASRSPEQRLILREDLFIRHVLHATEPELLRPLDQTLQELQEEQAALVGRLEQAFLAALERPELAKAFQSLVGEAVWSHLAPGSGLFMQLPVWLRHRFGLLMLSWQVGRLTMRGLHLLGLVGVGVSAGLMAMQGILPYRKMVEALGPDFTRQLHLASQDARRIVEDYGLEKLLPAEPAPAKTPPGAAESSGWAERIVAWLEKLLLQDVDPALLMLLKGAVDRTAEQTAQRIYKGISGRLLFLLANLIPAAMLFWIVWRLADAWWRESYLPWPFYAMALALLVACFFVGYCLVAYKVNRRIKTITPQQAFQGYLTGENFCGQGSPVQALQQIADRLKNFLHQVHRLRTLAHNALPRQTDSTALGAILLREK